MLIETEERGAVERNVVITAEEITRRRDREEALFWSAAASPVLRWRSLSDFGENGLRSHVGKRW